jgi:hypothetical protein
MSGYHADPGLIVIPTNKKWQSERRAVTIP